ncbi:MAG: Zn-ribbon domain-containing OB-fold protein [Planctomycetes bacterium]|nr:Zn-ribbon domain-containing OB-fold protein [Planctomycetota bacterium]
MAILERGGSNQKMRAWHGDIPITNHYTAGVGGERFFRELKENGRIVGGVCPACRETILPPRLFCERCFETIQELRPVPLPGWIGSVTRVHVDLDGRRLARPEWIAFVEFEGVRGGLIHRLEVAGDETPEIGDPVQPVFRPAAERQGGILDILHFRTDLGD